MSNLSPSDLMRQARDTAETYFNQAVRIIDEKFGEGYAKEHPELIAGFMKTAAKDFDTCMTRQPSTNGGSDITPDFDTCMTRQALDHLSSDFDRLANAIEGLELIPAGDKPEPDSIIDEDELLSFVAEQMSSVLGAAIDGFHSQMTQDNTDADEITRRIASGEEISSFSEQDRIEFAKDNPVLFAAFYRGFVDSYRSERTSRLGGKV